MLGVTPRYVEPPRGGSPQRMLALANCFEPGHVIPELQGRTKTSVIVELAGLAQRLGLVRDETWVVGALTPSTPAPDKATSRMRERARAIVGSALEEGRRWLHEEEAFLLLECYGIQAQPARLATGPEDAVRLARELGFPVTLRLSMRALGLRVELGSEHAVREVAAALFAQPGPALAGMPDPRVVVQAARSRPEALILMAGIASDPVFGRVIHLGPGGLQKRI